LISRESEERLKTGKRENGKSGNQKHKNSIGTIKGICRILGLIPKCTRASNKSIVSRNHGWSGGRVTGGASAQSLIGEGPLATGHRATPIFGTNINNFSKN
jgi:hypothetical protein